jgi:methylmalonyl-CoA mutase, C-terminal domain
VIERGKRAAPRRVRRVLLAKPGLDGHERGVHVIARLLRDNGYEVIYTGIRRRASEIAQAAIQEDVDVVGLSVLSGSHLSLTKAVMEALAEQGADDILVVVGGTVPEKDRAALQELGVSAVFGVETSFDEITAWFASA